MIYKFIKPIGEAGGFGQVYQCSDENHQIYALKQLIRKDDFAVTRFEREVRLISRLNHPNVIKLIAYNLDADNPFYVMPLYQRSLTSVISNLTGDYRRQLTVISSILSGISYLHSEGVIHRDLKPDNILYNSDTDIVITDFGLGIQVDSNSTRLTNNTIFGTERYMSPEQRRNSHNVDERTDIYAIGMIIEDIVSNFNSYHGYDEGIQYIIEKCTKRNPNERFASVSELNKYVNDVYMTIMGLSESQKIDQALLKLSRNKTAPEEIISLALQLNSSSDLSLIEKFISGIYPSAYTVFEKNNVDLAKDLIEKVCSYWNSVRWPFSDIDTIANVINKTFTASNNPEIKAALLYQLIALAIDFNRWYAMRVAAKLLNEIKQNKGVQAALAYKLRKSWLPIGIIVSNVNDLPPLIFDVYKENTPFI